MMLFLFFIGLQYIINPTFWVTKDVIRMMTINPNKKALDIN